MWTPASAPGRVSTERAPTAMRAAMPADEVSTAQDKRVPSEDKFRGAVDAMLASADAQGQKQGTGAAAAAAAAAAPQVGPMVRATNFHHVDKAGPDSPRKARKDRAPNLSARSGSTFSVSSLHSLNGFLSFDQDIQLSVDVQPSPSHAAGFALEPTNSFSLPNLDMKQLSINRSPKDAEVRDRRRHLTKQNSLWSPNLEEEKLQDLTPDQRRQLFASSKNRLNSNASGSSRGGSFFFPTMSSFSLSGRSFGRGDSFTGGLFAEEAEKMEVQDEQHAAKLREEAGRIPGTGIARIRRIADTVEPEQVGSLTPHGGLQRKKHNGAMRPDHLHVSFAQDSAANLEVAPSDTAFPLASPPPPMFAPTLSGSYSGSYSSLPSDGSSGELVNIPCYVGPQGNIIPVGMAPFNQMRHMMPAPVPHAAPLHGPMDGAAAHFPPSMPPRMMSGMEPMDRSDTAEYSNDKMAHASIEEKINHLYGDLKARLMTEFALAPSGKNNKMKNRDLIDFYKGLHEDDPEQKRLKHHFETHLALLLQERHRRHAMRQESQKKAAVRRPKGENGRFVKMGSNE